MRLFWHQRDLRTRDNVGLAAAAAGDAVVPVFVFDPALLATVGGRQRAFFTAGVRALRARYRELGGDLVVRSGDPAAVLPVLADRFDADGVTYNEHYRAARRDRQDRVADALADAGVDVDAATDLVLVDPARLAPAYRTHGAFHDDWERVDVRPPAPEPDSGTLAAVEDGTAVPPAGSAVDVPDPDVALPDAGYRPARERLEGFCERGLETYADTRDDLARAVAAPTEAVSRMSPYLAAGMIGVREVWATVASVYAAATGDARRNVAKYRDELSWREQYYHLLYYNRDLPETNYKDLPNAIAWRNDPDDLAAWKAGRTGYPLVDAGMRQLNEEGYVHNRPRQVVASFLTKHLLVDWRRGARYFTEQLVDHDYAPNYGNWQWIASTGTDPVDVRIFDPVAQMSKYDPDATFVTEYVPELRNVPAEKTVDWPTLPEGERERLAPDYPDPIVDRDAAYERAQRVFEEALGKR